LAGTPITSVGESPRHRLVNPSFRAILRRPSIVELKVFFCVSSTTHAPPLMSPIFGAAIQISAPFDAKKTSRQHDVTPRFGGSVLKGRGEDAASFEIVVSGDCIGCD